MTVVRLSCYRWRPGTGARLGQTTDIKWSQKKSSGVKRSADFGQDNSSKMQRTAQTAPETPTIQQYEHWAGGLLTRFSPESASPALELLAMTTGGATDQYIRPTYSTYSQ